MNSLESIKKSVMNYLERTSQEDEFIKWILVREEGFAEKVYDAFFLLITDITQTPEVITHILNSYTSGLDNFSTNRPFQTLIAYACVEALAIRRPKELKGPWETLVWIIVKYSSFSNTLQGNVLTAFRETNIETVQWITMICSKDLCPNPCLRLELFRFMRCFNCNDHFKYEKLFRDKVIITICELSDNYKSLTVDQLPNFSPIDLEFVMSNNKISIGNVMNENDLHSKKSEIIAALMKLSNFFALLVKEKQERRNNQEPDHEMGHARLENQLSACLSFCGLIPISQDRYIDFEECMLYFEQAVSNDSLLLNYMIDTLDTITKVSVSFPDEEDLQRTVIKIKGKLLHRLFENHIKHLHKHQYIQEIYGGYNPAMKYRLRYIQNDMVGQYNNSYYETVFNEDDYGSFNSEEMDFEEDISDEEDISEEEDISDEENILDEENI